MRRYVELASQGAPSEQEAQFCLETLVGSSVSYWHWAHGVFLLLSIVI
jgi:hypothetical protein